MSTRLTYSDMGYIRRMQMSAKTVWAFIEGKTDRFFYGRLCRAAYAPQGVPYVIATVQELPGGAHGKPALLAWFGFLRNHGALCSTLGGKKTVAAVFVDKDIDDLLGQVVASDHLFYTEFYNLENHLFASGRIFESLAAAAMLESASVETALGISEADWRRRAVESWRAWSQLCLFARRYALNAPLNFSRQSQVHSGPYRPIDIQSVYGFIGVLREVTQLDRVFEDRFAETVAEVDAIYVAGSADKVFNGKWYIAFAIADAKSIAANRAYDTAVGDKLPQLLALSADIDGHKWSAQTVERLQALLECEA